MEKSQILDKTRICFEKVLEHKNFELKPETTASDVDGWDSITHMMIVAEVEETFEIKFTLMELMGMDNFGMLLELIISKTNS